MSDSFIVFSKKVCEPVGGGKQSIRGANTDSSREGNTDSPWGVARFYGLISSSEVRQIYIGRKEMTFEIPERGLVHVLGSSFSLSSVLMHGIVRRSF